MALHVLCVTGQGFHRITYDHYGVNGERQINHRSLDPSPVFFRWHQPDVSRPRAPPVEMVTLGRMNGAGVKQLSWLSVPLLRCKRGANPKEILIWFPWKDGGVAHFQYEASLMMNLETALHPPCNLHVSVLFNRYKNVRTNDFSCLGDYGFMGSFFFFNLNGNESFLLFLKKSKARF